MGTSRKIAAGAAALTWFAAVAVAAPSPALAHGNHPPGPPTVTVMATGLLNPRGVSVNYDGTVYVAESGAGGTTLASGLVEGQPASVCLGDTGGVTRVRRGRVARIADLPSLTEAAVDANGTPSCDPASIGFGSTGPSDAVALFDGSVSVVTGLGGNTDTRTALPAEFGDSFGKLFNISRRGQVRAVADITAHEDAANPDGVVPPDSNPYGVAAYFGGYLVADAGGNDIVRVDWRGRTSTVAVLPPVDVTVPEISCPRPPGLPPAGVPIPAQAVPTSVTIGLDGNAYVGQLTGFPFAPGAASVWRINPWTGAMSEYATGFTNIVGVAAAWDGTLYVVEIARGGLLDGETCGNLAGRLVRIARDGTQTEIPVPGLVAPGGVAVGLDGTVYVTNHSVEPGGAGELLAIRTR